MNVARDSNRFHKSYPFVRGRPRLSTSSALVEADAVTFSSSTEETFAFNAAFSKAPIVTFTAIDSENNDQANINAWINDVSSTQVIVNVSAAFTGKIHFHAIEQPAP